MILLNLFSLIIIGVCAAFCTRFVEYLIGDPWDDRVNTGAIFSIYGVWVAHGYEKKQRALESKITGTLHSEDKYAATHLNMYKALGACIYCFNVYVTTVFCAVIFFLHDISFWYLVLTLPVSHVALHIYMDRFD